MTIHPDLIALYDGNSSSPSGATSREAIWRS
jgi:hypothetical protein